MLKRDDMLELTRRMTPARNCFDRVAGAYINDMGEVDESFNIHFGKLSGSEKARNICCICISRSVRCAVKGKRQGKSMGIRGSI